MCGGGRRRAKILPCGKVQKIKRCRGDRVGKGGEKMLIHFQPTLIKSNHRWQLTIVLEVYKVSLRAWFLMKWSTSSTKGPNDTRSPIRLLKYNKDPLSQINVFLFSQSLPFWKCVSNHSSLFLDLLLLYPGPAVNCGGRTKKSFMWKEKKKGKKAPWVQCSLFLSLSFSVTVNILKETKRKDQHPFQSSKGILEIKEEILENGFVSVCFPTDCHW